MKKATALLIAALALTSVFAAAGAAAQTVYTISIGGSTSVTPLIEALQAEYAKVKPNVRTNISGTGSGDGITNAGVNYQIG
ncbi:MAG: substrate-binding domain-containing protein, partial [Acidobacteria bacterium]|nr:substrate-binding domain-containing protein [Acidobacteriota bacterium]